MERLDPPRAPEEGKRGKSQALATCAATHHSGAKCVEPPKHRGRHTGWDPTGRIVGWT